MPYLSQALGSAQTLYSGTPQGQYMPYPGQRTIDMQTALVQGLQGQKDLALANMGGTPGVNAARGLGLNMIQNQGMTPELQRAAGQYQTLYDEASGQQNPYLQAMINTSNRQIGDRVNAAMSGAGRYGSGQHTDVMARALGEAADPILSQDYARRQQQRMQATGAAADVYGQGLQRAGQWSQLMPTLDEAQYAPAERLAAIGQYETNYQQQKLNDSIDYWNAIQRYPAENLARYNAMIGGAGQLGGSSSMSGTTTGPTAQQPSSLQRLFGGATAGAGLGSMFGPVGTGVGAIGGGLLGMMG